MVEVVGDADGTDVVEVFDGMVYSGAEALLAEPGDGIEGAEVGAGTTVASAGIHVVREPEA